jgi:hypothetical protein
VALVAVMRPAGQQGHTHNPITLTILTTLSLYSRVTT